MSSLRPSPSQQHVVTVLGEGNNVVVSSLAGGGKSTTVSEIGKWLSQSQRGEKMLILVYNRKMRESTEKKMKHFKAECRTIHGFAFCAYNVERTAANDFKPTDEDITLILNDTSRNLTNEWRKKKFNPFPRAVLTQSTSL